ncbi:MAG: helix-turn-helix domain-containing protein [Clostridiales bacterium]|nr:helix-turn-helix domain-containing protein [Clostridiales bacterium]
MITLTQIHVRLAEAIRQSGIKQTELANYLHIGQSNISHYIKGDKMPALDTLANLCKLLDIDANYILCQE